MRLSMTLFGPFAFCLACAAIPGAKAADAEVTYIITNGGEKTDAGQVHFHPQGRHDASDVAWAGSGGAARMPAGTYDVHVTFSEGGAHKDFWIDHQTFAGTVEKTVEIGLPLATVRYVITNGGADTEAAGQVHYHPHGHHDASDLAWSGSGGPVTIPAGTYDVHVSFDTGSAHKDFWIDNQSFAGTIEKTAEIGLPTTDVTYTVTNGGEPTDHGQVHYVAHGHHDGPEIAWAGNNEHVVMPAGRYDVHVIFEDGPLHKEKWLDDQAFSGKVERGVEVDASAAVARVRYVITNGGVDVEAAGQVHFLPAGHHDGAEAAWSGSGGTVRILSGAYDVHVVYSDGNARKDVWIDNQVLADTIDRTVEIGLALADIRAIITNGGVDTQDKGQVHYVPHGRHDGPEAAWSGSGGRVRIPAGTYDVHIVFDDGAAHKDFWIDNQPLSGKLERSADVGLPLTDVRLTITNGGVDVADKGQAHYAPHGHHEGPMITWAASGGAVRMAAGTFDVAILYRDGLINKEVWLDNQPFAGTVEKTVELGLLIAEPTVSVTQNGTDVGDKARIAFVDPATHGDFGSVPSNEAARLEARTYDIHATLFGAEGWLRGVALSGKQHLTIDIKPLVTEQLKVGGPPPTACAIVIYGVNFDFDKAALRPDSEPMLQQVLALFTRNPAFSAEVGGHTDNVGTADYNARLSDARAAAVKAWLIGHGVVPARVSSRGYGDSRPLVPNTTDENRFKNRRVELRTAACR